MDKKGEELLEILLEKTEKLGIAKVDEMNPSRFCERQRQYFEAKEQFETHMAKLNCSCSKPHYEVLSDSYRFVVYNNWKNRHVSVYYIKELHDAKKEAERLCERLNKGC